MSKNFFLTVDAITSSQRISQLDCHLQNADQTIIDELLDLAEDISTSELRYLNPLYIKSVAQYTTYYRSLIICQDGRVYGTSYSTDRTVSSIFERFGFTYQEWRAYWKATFKINTHIPYVCGRRILIRIPSDNCRYFDWVDCSVCDVGELISTKTSQKPLKLTLRSQNDQHDLYRFQFVLTERLKKIIQQFKLAFSFAVAWQKEEHSLIHRYDLPVSEDNLMTIKRGVYTNPSLVPTVPFDCHSALSCFLHLHRTSKILNDKKLQSYLPEKVTNQLKQAYDNHQRMSSLIEEDKESILD